MADQDTPLTDAERAELEQLRAEKARRERAELEQLRAEATGAVSTPAYEEAPKAAAPQPKAAPGPVSEAADTASASTGQPQPTSRPASATGRPEASSSEAHAAPPRQRERSFGERMVLSEGEDEDGVPSMPPAQKIIIAIALVAFICGAVYVALSNAGALG